jgi:hypothetical protein
MYETADMQQAARFKHSARNPIYCAALMSESSECSNMRPRNKRSHFANHWVLK